MPPNSSRVRDRAHVVPIAATLGRTPAHLGRRRARRPTSTSPTEDVRLAILRGVTLRVDSGAVAGLVGRNGAGKTTTRAIYGRTLTCSTIRSKAWPTPLAHRLMQAAQEFKRREPRLSVLIAGSEAKWVKLLARGCGVRYRVRSDGARVRG